LGDFFASCTIWIETEALKNKRQRKKLDKKRRKDKMFKKDKKRRKEENVTNPKY
jgi:hypothetical protein